MKRGKAAETTWQKLYLFYRCNRYKRFVQDSVKPRTDVSRNREGTDKAKRRALVHDVLLTSQLCKPNVPASSPHQLENANKVIAVGTGAALLAYGAVRRSPAGAWIAAASVPFFYRAFVGHWPEPFRALGANGNTKRALSGDRGVHVREAVRLELPIHEVYSFWRRFENLPRFMRHLDSVREDGAIARTGWRRGLLELLSSGTPS